MTHHDTVGFSDQCYGKHPCGPQGIDNELFDVGGMWSVKERRFGHGVYRRSIGCCFCADGETHEMRPGDPENVCSLLAWTGQVNTSRHRAVTLRQRFDETGWRSTILGRFSPPGMASHEAASHAP